MCTEYSEEEHRCEFYSMVQCSIGRQAKIGLIAIAKTLMAFRGFS